MEVASWAHLLTAYLAHVDPKRAPNFNQQEGFESDQQYLKAGPLYEQEFVGFMVWARKAAKKVLDGSRKRS